MDLNDYKITQQEIDVNNVKSAKDDYIGTPAKEVKNIFDKLPELMAQKHNEVIDKLTGTDGADNIGMADGKTVEENVMTHISDENNPHKVTKADVGLSKVENTSDYDKPLSYLQERALDDLKNNVLTLDNTTPYEPTEDFHPVTLKALNEVAIAGGSVASVFGEAGIITTLDCGNWSSTAIEIHNSRRRAHANITLDGTQDSPSTSDIDFGQHKTNTTAHTNIVVDGKEKN